MGRGATADLLTAASVVRLRGLARRDATARDELRPVIEDLQGTIDPTLPKTAAAEILGVSINTLDKWIARGRVPVVDVAGYQRARIPTAPLLALASEVSELKRMGEGRGLLAQAIVRLEQEDPQWQREFDQLYGENLDAMERGDLVKLDLNSFGPDD
ncbi:MAG: hypothetical protein H0X28_05035 [Solirubrobacterales bacterium]|nr:hypothetical protein [Solirubrobacterales bacterium]